jgi:hypothetical protein
VPVTSGCTPCTGVTLPVFDCVNYSFTIKPDVDTSGISYKCCLTGNFTTFFAPSGFTTFDLCVVDDGSIMYNAQEFDATRGSICNSETPGYGCNDQTQDFEITLNTTIKSGSTGGIIIVTLDNPIYWYDVNVTNIRVSGFTGSNCTDLTTIITQPTSIILQSGQTGSTLSITLPANIVSYRLQNGLTINGTAVLSGETYVNRSIITTVDTPTDCKPYTT